MNCAASQIQQHTMAVQQKSLRQAPKGSEVTVVSFSPNLQMKQKEHLSAYGLVPGKLFNILQHSPVTVIQVDFTEIALEAELAEQIIVEYPNIL